MSAGLNGATATAAFLSGATGTHVELIDDRGIPIGELAARPEHLTPTCTKPSGNDTCLLTSFNAVSVGGEVLFLVQRRRWAFDLRTQTWRTFPLDGRQPGRDGTEVVAACDLLFA